VFPFIFITHRAHFIAFIIGGLEKLPAKQSDPENDAFARR